jgi:hypothetical protein
VLDTKYDSPLGWLEGDAPETVQLAESIAGMFGVREAQCVAKRYARAQRTMELILATPGFSLLRLRDVAVG